MVVEPRCLCYLPISNSVNLRLDMSRIGMRAEPIENKTQIRQRKELGAFYTPSQLAVSLAETAINRYLLTHLNSLFSSSYTSLENVYVNTDLSIIERLNDILLSVKILDGSAGEGEFLRAALTIIYLIKEKIDRKLFVTQKTSTEASFDILSSALYGMEINPDAVTNCHKNVMTIIPESQIASTKKIFKKNIIEGDFLGCTLANWKNLPSTSKGFDIILGNPPWGGKLTKKQREKYYNQFTVKSPKRNLNTFSLFVYKATELLTPDGVLSYLLPKNVSRSNQYIYLREFLLTNFQIFSINFHGLFKDVTQEFISLIGSKKNEIPSDHTILVDHETIIPQSFYLANIDYIFSREYDIRSQRLIQLIQKDASPLGQFLTIKRGEELSKRGGVMYCPTCSWVPLSSRKRRVICPQCQQPLSNQNLRMKYLIQKIEDPPYIQPILTGDDFEAYRIISTHFIDPSVSYRSKKNSLNYRSPKLVVQKIKRFPCAAYDSDNHWTTQNVYCMALRSEYAEKKELLYYILAVLNSSLYHWFYESQFNLGSRYTNAISIRNLRRLPLKTPDFNIPLFTQIIQLAKEITEELKLKKRSLRIQELDRLVLQYYQCETIPVPNL